MLTCLPDPSSCSRSALRRWGRARPIRRLRRLRVAASGGGGLRCSARGGGLRSARGGGLRCCAHDGGLRSARGGGLRRRASHKRLHHSRVRARSRSSRREVRVRAGGCIGGGRVCCDYCAGCGYVGAGHRCAGCELIRFVADVYAGRSTGHSAGGRIRSVRAGGLHRTVCWGHRYGLCNCRWR
jgi:hypothetical protein